MLQDHYGYGNFDVIDENQEMAFLMREGWGLGLGNKPGSYPKNCSAFLNTISVVYDEELNLEEIEKVLNKNKQTDYHTSIFPNTSKNMNSYLTNINY